MHGSAMRERGLLACTMGLGLLAAAACAPLQPSQLVPPPPQVVAPPPAPPPVSAESARIRAHFTRNEEMLRGRGLMRTETNPDDVPFGVATLVRNFDRIALRDEYAIERGRIVARESPSRLRRWQSPVRMGLEFGADVPEAQRAQDTATVRDLAARLARITGHPITVTDRIADANFRILVLTEEERRAAGPRLQRLVPGIDPLTRDTITGMPLSTTCLVVAFASQGSWIYSDALAVIRAELPDLTRRSCFHEELAQGLGLPNDSDAARPSIFNDTLEFALLTRHDELLLRILYDPRLRPGMTPAQARPIVEAIAVELIGGEV
ncbi:MAG: DUF2927 domain-containing protein [Alkalilacustris sp.]